MNSQLSSGTGFLIFFLALISLTTLANTQVTHTYPPSCPQSEWKESSWTFNDWTFTFRKKPYPFQHPSQFPCIHELTMKTICTEHKVIYYSTSAPGTIWYGQVVGGLHFSHFACTAKRANIQWNFVQNFNDISDSHNYSITTQFQTTYLGMSNAQPVFVQTTANQNTNSGKKIWW